MSARVRYPMPQGEFEYVDCPECGMPQRQITDDGRVFIASHDAGCSLIRYLVVAIKELAAEEQP